MGDIMKKINMGKGVLIPSYNCNYLCECCYAKSELNKNREMQIDEAKKSIDFMSELGINTFTILGGEPLLYKGINEIIEYSSNSNIGTWIVTNGAKLVDSNIGNELKDSGLSGGCISFFSTDSNIHDKISGVNGSFAKGIEAVRLSNVNNWGFYPMITVGEKSISRFLENVYLFTEIGCNKIYINYGVPDINDESDSDFDAQPKKLADFTEYLYLSQKEFDVKFIFNRFKNKIPLCHFSEDILHEMIMNDQIGVGCELMSGNTVVIEPGGNVIGCSHWVEHTLLNIYKDYKSLKMISVDKFWDEWLHRYPKKFRDNLACYPYKECIECDYMKKGDCFGGCKTWQVSGKLPKYCKVTK